MKRTGRLAVLVWLTMAVPYSDALAQTPPPTLKISEHQEHGEYLTDKSGMSLYLFEEDRPDGDRGRPVESDCVDDCLERWPVLVSQDPPQVEGEAHVSLVGSFQRPDGKRQATYNGWPLYYFADDFVPGDINGHDFEEFGGEWYLMTPDGHALGQNLDDDHRNRMRK